MSNFLKLEGIVGESGNPRHIGEFDILSAVSGYRVPIQHSLIPKSGKVFHDIEISRKQDEDSHKLVTAAMSGRIFPNGKITIESTENPNGSSFDMNNVSIAAYSSNKSVEIISLTFEFPS